MAKKPIIPESDDELLDPEYLRDLAERIFRIPAMYGVDQYDFDRLRSLASELEGKQ